MNKITAWSAKRSADTMTIMGRDETGNVVRVAHVVSIEGALPWPIAKDCNGRTYQLVSDEGDHVAPAADGVLRMPMVA